MRMINEAKEGLEDLLCYNDTIREQEEDLQHQEEAWREDERISKAQEEVEERKQQAEMETCMNKKQQVTENQQAAKLQCNLQRNNNLSIRSDSISEFRLIPSPLFHQMTRWKHRWMTHRVQVQGKNQTIT